MLNIYNLDQITKDLHDALIEKYKLMRASGEFPAGRSPETAASSALKIYLSTYRYSANKVIYLEIELEDVLLENEKRKASLVAA